MVLLGCPMLFRAVPSTLRSDQGTTFGEEEALRELREAPNELPFMIQ